MSAASSPEVDVEVAVIGGGAVGLAIAAAFAATGREAIVLEANHRCGDETSGRNNQVIHAGFLYPPGTLKARLCRAGHGRLLDYARARSVPHSLQPKLIPVPDEAGTARLEALRRQGAGNGVRDLELLDAGALAALEPELRAAAALLSPATGVIDAPALVAALEAELQAAGGGVVTRSRAIGARPAPGATILRTLDPDGSEGEISCRWLVNAAGLGAAAFARRVEGFPADAAPRIHLARGQFLSHRGAVPFSHMVVPLDPVLSAGGALTTDMAGQARFGPDLSFLDEPSYLPDDAVPDHAVRAIRSWWPGLDAERLEVDFVGIRPRVTGPGEAPGDWVVAGPAQHGQPRQIHLFGIDTPGLTACLTLAEHVVSVAGLSPHP